jgi:hypothetical protein
MFFEASDWFIAFLLTLTIELPIVLLLLRRIEPDLARMGALVVFANLATHPIVWFVLTQPLLIGTPEAVFYAVTLRGLGARRALGVSLAANAASFLVGQVVLDRMLEILR